MIRHHTHQNTGLTFFVLRPLHFVSGQLLTLYLQCIYIVWAPTEYCIVYCVCTHVNTFLYVHCKNIFFFISYLPFDSFIYHIFDLSD